MITTAHSEYGKLKSLFIKKASDAFINDAQVEKEWKQLNFLSKPDFSNAVSEYKKFEEVLQQYAETVFHLPPFNNVTMDSIYCRDAAIATNKGMIICNMGKPARNNEPKAEQTAFEKNNIPVLGIIQSPGTVEGGDVAWLDENTLAVGHTYRTNNEGIDQLQALLNTIGVHVVVAELPHYKGPSDVFHLMSIFSPVDKDLAVVYSPLMPIAFRDLLLKRNYKLVEVPDEEFDTMGCNVLALAPRVCLMVNGNPKTKSLLEAAGGKVIEYKGEDISVKGGGGPTCLTRPVWREV
ncbi:MAG TPA: arginine deiminase family protein [Puia sp.]|nr:arginine deiminase family protein [Puia sp.]